MPPPQTRLGDNAKVPADAHCCPACPHTCIGPFIMGSPNVFVNSLPATRKTDVGVHAVCCNANIFFAKSGSGTVFINGLDAIRKGDPTTHCGGSGTVQVGSPDVFTGG